MDALSSTHCTVVILGPAGRSFTFSDTRAADAGLLAVETSKDMAEACGSFTLHFDPRPGPDGRTWDQRIPRRSLVAIKLQRLSATTSATEEETVMLGFTDDHGRQEAWQEAQPRRSVHVHGRDMGSVIVDAMLWFHPGLSEDVRLGTLTELTKGLGAQVVAVVFNPTLPIAGEDPKATLKRLLDVYLFQGLASVAPSTIPGLQQPVIGVDIPGQSLSDLLDINAAAWNTFEPVQVPMPQMPAEVGSLWNVLHLFIDRAFQEFFTRVEGGVVKIHFRGKPFKHEVITSGSRFKPTTGEAGEPTLHTLRLDPSDLITQQLQCRTANVYNVFSVVPLGMSDWFRGPALLPELAPQIIKEADHPSFIGRYGLRILSVQTRYLSPIGAPDTSTSRAAPQPLQPLPAASAHWAPIANRIAKEQGLPANLRPWFVALIRHESAFDPNAQGPVLRSGQHAQGIAQWVAPYPAGVGLVNPLDPTNALEAAARYWNQMRAMPWIGDDPHLLVAGYNAGPNAVQTYRGVPPYADTRKLVRDVTATMPHYAGMAGEVGMTPIEDGAESPLAPEPPAKPGALAGHFPEMVQKAQHWAAILRGWYDMGGEFFGGILTVRGHPRWNLGHRMLTRDERGEWEAYIEGVSHRYDMRTGQYLTSLRVTRGWYLSAAIAHQLWAEGKTTVEETRGGPPARDPETGAAQPDQPAWRLHLEQLAPIMEPDMTSGRPN